MANVVLSGGPIPGPMATFTPLSTWTDPAVGDLVILDTTANYNVDECADGELPTGIVRGVSRDLTELAVELFTGGCIARLLADTVAKGDAISADRTAGAGYVDTDGVGIGVVVAINIVTGYADVLFV